MTTSGRSWGWKIAVGVAVGGAIPNGCASLHASGDCAIAQITPDGTLLNNSIVTPQGNTSVIEGGTQAGTNLFHSFEQFSVPTGGAAHFNNALNVQNIFSRVTGGSVSNIDGLLRANGTANLFLLNPNGIIFGSNARLNIGGSFLGSTASSLSFADGTNFSATAPQTTPLLTVNVPVGLQYGGTTPGSILNLSRATDSSGQIVDLQVQPGKNLALVGGDVRLDGGNLFAPGGRVELGGVAGAGTVGLNVDGDNLSLSFPDGLARADVSLTNGAIVNVRAFGGGSIVINAQNLNISGESTRVRAGIGSGLSSVDFQAGDIEINATEAINLDTSVISNVVQVGAVGNAGNINIQTGSLSVTNGAQLQALTDGQGNAGSVNINARETVFFDGAGSNRLISAASSRVNDGAEGNAGNINIQTGSLFVTNGAQLQALTDGQGNAGSVNIDARDTVFFDGVGSNWLISAASSRVNDGAVGKGGNINIQTGSLFVTNGAQLQALTDGRGDAGSVNINARDTVFFDGVGSNGRSSAASSRVNDGAEGNAGDINIQTGSLSVTNGAQLQALTDGQGNAGSVNINARETVFFDGVGSNRLISAASSRVNDGAEGNAGDINIQTGSLFVTNGAQLQALTDGRGDAGSVNINARDTVFFDGVGSNGRSSAASSRVNDGAEGNAGNINITTGSLSVTNGAELSTSSEGSGAAGNIEVRADSIRLDNRALLSSDTRAGQGNIILRSQDLVLRRGSNITTNAIGRSAGGNITINTDIIAALENSDISANAQEARGGRVIIDAFGIFGTEFRERGNPATSDITATSLLGPEFSGTVEINTPDVDPSAGLVALPIELVDASRLIATSCAASGENEFIVTGRGGLPPNPSEPLSSDTVWSDLRFPTQQARIRSSSEPATNPTNPAPTQIVEATGWVINNNGQVVLTANVRNATPHNPWLRPANCHTSKNSS